MSALDKFLESRKVDTRTTGEIQDGYKVYETVHDELYESALVELTTLRAQLAEAREALELLSQYKNHVEDGEVKTDKCGTVHVSDFAKSVLEYLDKVTTA